MNCRDCCYLRRETESWEMPWVQWWSCAARPTVENLRSFPFKNTKCQKFKAQEGK